MTDDRSNQHIGIRTNKTVKMDQKRQLFARQFKKEFYKNVSKLIIS